MQKYNFIFNEDFIIENALEGKHEFDLPADIANGNEYKEEMIRADAISFYMGLDDVAKKDNYLVSSTNKIVFIDFDVIDRMYTLAERNSIKENTAKQLSISVEEYKKSYAKQEQRLAILLCQRRDNISLMLDIFKTSRELSSLGEYIRANTNNLLQKYGFIKLEEKHDI